MKILVISAHLDDTELACGGTLAKAAKAGHEIKALIMSKSGYTNAEGKVMRENSEAIADGTRALNILGVTDIEILDFPTKDIPYSSQSIEAIDRCIAKFNPDVIFCHHPEETHQAHSAAAKAAIAAARRKNTVFLFEPFVPSRCFTAFKPQMYVDISNEIDLKIKALKQHRTEYQKFGEGWITGVKSRAGFRGFEIGKDYAEAFEVLRCELDFGNAGLLG